MILFIQTVFDSTVENIKKHPVLSQFDIAVITDDAEKKFHEDVIKIHTDFDNGNEIKKSLKKYQDALVAVTCRREGNIPQFIKTIPYVPNLKTPSVESLDAATHKALMRKRFNQFDSSISPRNTSVEMSESIEDILIKRSQVSDYPVIIKPTGLHASLLVTVAHNEQEFVSAIKNIKNHPKAQSKNAHIMIEEFFDGELLSTDAYVNSRGNVFFTPFVHVTTAKMAGKNDLYGYERIIPSNLSQTEAKTAQQISIKGIKALDLKSTSVHIELLKKDKAWRLVEIGPRLGGFRNQMYRDSYEINHEINDILIRMDAEPVIPTELKKSIAVLQRYAETEGTLKEIAGIEKIQNLKSFNSIKIKNKPGDQLVFARNGGISPVNIILLHKNPDQVKKDSSAVDELLEIITEES